MKYSNTKHCAKSFIIMMILCLAGGVSLAQEVDDIELLKTVEKNEEAPKGSAENPLVLTAQQAVDYALENSASIKTGKIDLQLSEWKKNTSWNSFLPNVQVTGSLSRTNEVSNSMASIMKAINPMYVAPETTEANHWVAMGNLGLSFSFNAAMIQTMRAAFENYEAGKITWQQTLNETEMSVRKLFYALLLQQESLKIQESSLENARQRQNQAAINYRNGYVPELYYLQAQVSYANLLPQVTKARQEFAQQLDTFSFLLGLPVGTKIELDGVIQPEFIEVDADELVDLYLNDSLTLRQLDTNIKALKMQASALDLSTYTPSLSISWAGQPMITNATDTDWGNKDNWHDNGSLSFALAWNLTNMLPWSSTRSSAKELRMNIDKMQISRGELVKSLEMEIRKAVDSLNLSKAVINSSQRRIDLAQRSYNMTLQAYRNGTKELLEVRDAEDQLNQAKLAMLSDQFNYMSNLWNLENELNRKLTKNK